ncbi:hypothetical protein NQ318_019095 [Aromia moschata]|uniref:Uncharacterized protein n=1 Tax=Aromia moschata TaxID=1265417 RepID=A0AAV8Y7V4_9CUCU|nr:hypothetical protein NQ318_019095 [Aromia moschata]
MNKYEDQRLSRKQLEEIIDNLTDYESGTETEQEEAEPDNASEISEHESLASEIDSSDFEFKEQIDKRNSVSAWCKKVREGKFVKLACLWITEVIHVLVRCAQLKECLVLSKVRVKTQEPQLVTEHNLILSDTVTLKGARFKTVEAVKTKAAEVLNQLTEATSSTALNDGKVVWSGVEIAKESKLKAKKLTEREKIAKYENLSIELKRLWKLEKVETYALVISAEGVMTTRFAKNIAALGLSYNIIRNGQKAVLLQTCHIVRKVLGQDEFPPLA